MRGKADKGPKERQAYQDIGYTELDIAVANNQSSHGVTRKHYLAGQLAKQELLTRMYRDLEAQYRYYEYDNGGAIRKVPDQWEPEDYLTTDEEWLPSPEEIEHNPNDDF